MAAREKVTAFTGVKMLATMAMLAQTAACAQFRADGAGPGEGGVSPVGMPHQLLLRDEAQSMVSYVEIGNPAAGWHATVPEGRDLQLVGNGRFLIGTDDGYEERSLTDGTLVMQQAAFPGTVSAHRLRNGHTILAGVDWQGGSGVVLVEVDGAGAIAQTIGLPDFSFVRLVRQTVNGTFLVTVDDAVVEAAAGGQIVWRANVPRVNQTASNVWQALRVETGDTVISTGDAASIEVFALDQTLSRTISGPVDVVPNQYAGFEILPGGNYLVANWLGHSGEATGVQLLEYDPEGALVWSYRPDPVTESLSLQQVIVLDGLDPSQLYVDDKTGLLEPVPVPAP